MNIIDKDILGAQDVYNTKYSPNYNKVYYNTNEDLINLFNNVNINNKDVLTVLGSGDQSFVCYEKDARSVDVFDINKLTIYYYYLRVWVIEHLNTFYPENKFDKNYIYKILDLVVPKTEDEMNAYNYWKVFVSKNFIDYSRFFYFTNYFKITDVNLDKIKRRLMERNFTFYNVDISKPWIHDKKYDVIITSNISDYIPKTIDSFICYRDNLCNLLKDDGIVLCSKIGYNTSSCERDSFKDVFKRNSFSKKWTCGKLESPGYSYKKR